MIKDMFACNNIEHLIELLGKKKIVIYGSGYIATFFYESLKKHELEKNIACFVVSDFAQNVHGNFGRFEIKPINEISITENMVVCIATHESFAGEIESVLKQKKVENYVWIYPFLFDLYYGNPIKRGEWIAIEKLLPKDEDCYALTVRWAAVADYYGKCPNGFGWYKRAMISLHNLSATEARIKIFKQLINNWAKNGYDGEHEIAINEDYEVLDGEHRMAVALYHGERMIKCRIYSGKNINSERSFMKRDMLIESGFDEDEIKQLEDINDRIKKFF